MFVLCSFFVLERVLERAEKSAVQRRCVKKGEEERILSRDADAVRYAENEEDAEEGVCVVRTGTRFSSLVSYGRRREVLLSEVAKMKEIGRE